MVGECAINKGTILSRDDVKGSKRKISDVSFHLREYLWTNQFVFFSQLSWTEDPSPLKVKWGL
jgi:hypothetical protein